MKTTYFFLFSLCAGSVYAAPPILGGAYNDYTPAAYSTYDAPQPPAASINQIQSDVANLKVIVNDLSKRQGKLEQRVFASNPSSSTNPISSNYQNIMASPVNSGTHGLASSPLEKDRYSRAYAIFRDGGYDQAIAEFQSIVGTYPTGEYADNSEYWTGEALLKKGDKQRAMQAFDRVVRAYPKSPKVPDALLKLGMTQYSMGNKAKAKEYLDYVIYAYPGKPAANLAYTKKLQAGL